MDRVGRQISGAGPSSLASTTPRTSRSSPACACTQVEVDEPRGRADSLRVFDLDGRRVLLSKFHGAGAHASFDMPILDGRSDVPPWPRTPRRWCSAAASRRSRASRSVFARPDERRPLLRGRAQPERASAGASPSWLDGGGAPGAVAAPHRAPPPPAARRRVEEPPAAAGRCWCARSRAARTSGDRRRSRGPGGAIERVLPELRSQAGRIRTSGSRGARARGELAEGRDSARAPRPLLARSRTSASRQLDRRGDDRRAAGGRRSASAARRRAAERSRTPACRPVQELRVAGQALALSCGSPRQRPC